MTASPRMKWIAMTPYPAWLGVATNAAQWERLVRFSLGGHPVPSTPAATVLLPVPPQAWARIAVWINVPRDASPAYMCGLLAHEAFHVSEFVAEKIREEKWSSEAHAYLIQYVTEYCMVEYTRLARPPRANTAR